MKFGALSKAFFPDYKMPGKPTAVDRNIQRVIDADNRVVRMTKTMMNDMLQHYLMNKDAEEIYHVTHSIVNNPRKSTLWMMTSRNIKSLYNKKLKFVDAIGDKEIFQFEEEDVKVHLNRIGTTQKSITLGIFYYLSTLAVTVAGDHELEVHLTRDQFDAGDLIQDLFPARIVKNSEENIITIKGNNILKRPLHTTNLSLESLLTPDFNLSKLSDKNDFVSEATSIIKDNVTNPDFSLNDLADILCVSPRTLQRKLKQENTSFIELKNTERVELIMKHLAQGHTKENLSHLVGYKDINSIHKLLAKFEKK